MNTLSSSALAVWSASINLMAVSVVPGSAHRAGPLDNGDIYSICIAYVPIAAKVVNKQMLSIKQWESRIIIFDRWMKMTGLKRLPRSFMQIAFPTAWISASMRRLEVWKWIGKRNSTLCNPPTVGEGCECVSSTGPTGQEMQEDGLLRCQERQRRATLQEMHHSSFILQEQDMDRTQQKTCQTLWDRSAVQQGLPRLVETSVGVGMIFYRSCSLERFIEVCNLNLLWEDESRYGSSNKSPTGYVRETC